MIHVISLCHMEPPTIAASLMQLKRTTGRTIDLRMWLIDHHWPIDSDLVSDCITDLSEMTGARTIMPDKNLGGTGGFNWALREIASREMLKSDDLLLWYDPDSWPVTRGWLQAMTEVMAADPSIATLSLWAPQEMSGRDDWVAEVIAGHKVRTFPSHAEGFSVTMWRANFAMPKVEAEYEFYGQIEEPAYQKAKRIGKRNAWLADFHEIPCPIPHPKVYEDWKREHVARRFNGNFKEYYEQHAGK